MAFSGGFAHCATLRLRTDYFVGLLQNLPLCWGAPLLRQGEQNGAPFAAICGRGKKFGLKRWFTGLKGDCGLWLRRIDWLGF
jgi:hypothetical protein